MFKAINLSKRFGQHFACQKITFNIPKNSITGLVGPNGAGKTTLLRMLAGELRPDNGEIFFDNQLVSNQPEKLRAQVAILPDGAPADEDMRVKEYLSFRQSLEGFSDKGAIDHWIEECNLKDVSKRLIGHLSRGFRQRVGLAGTLATNARVLLLDEPSSGLDPGQRKSFRDLLLKLTATRTILYSSHQLEEIRMSCDQIAIISEGEIIIQGTPEEIVIGNKEDISFFISAKKRDLIEIFSDNDLWEIVSQNSLVDEKSIVIKSKLESNLVKEKIHDLLSDKKCIPTELYEIKGTLESAYANLVGGSL